MSAPAMRRVALLRDRYKDPEALVCARIATILERLGCEAVILPEASGIDGAARLADVVEGAAGIDLVLSLGGDGTFLRAVHLAWPDDCPVLGVNLGSLGFLAEVDVAEAEGAMARLVAGDYQRESRMMLSASLRDGEGRERERGFALNEILLTRAGNPRIVSVDFYIDGDYIERIAGDGVMVSTPTGSTGYAMAAGGPIADPTLEVLQLTPVCPHSLHNRSYLLPPERELTLRLGPYPYDALLSIDGRRHLPFGPDDAVHIVRADKPLTMIRLAAPSFFRDLPDKLRGRAVVRHPGDEKGEA